jgi:hypothetical protein
MQTAQCGRKEEHICNDVDATEALMTVNRVEYASTKDCIYNTSVCVCIRSQWKPYNMMCKCSAQRHKYQSVTTMKFAGDNITCQYVCHKQSKIVVKVVIYVDSID